MVHEFAPVMRAGLDYLVTQAAEELKKPTSRLGMEREGWSHELTYIWPFPPIRWPSQGDEGRAERDILVQPGQSGAAELTAVAAPYVPPEILQPTGGWVLELFVGDGVNCGIQDQREGARDG